MEPRKGPRPSWELRGERNLAQRREVEEALKHRRIARQQNEEPDDGPTDADLERFSGVTQRCPKCNTELYDDAAICWSCGEALLERDRHGSGASWWVVTIVVSLVIAVMIWGLR